MRVLVTGASRGIGRAVCLRLAADGAAVAACGSAHPDELEALVAEIRDAGGRAVGLTGDLADPGVPAGLVDDAVAALGGLDGVVSNAGITRPAPLDRLALADWDRIFAVNVRAAWLLARAAQPHLAATAGSFVAVGSMSGVQPYAGMGAYSPSKAALIMLVRVLAQEWASAGIRVNAVSPGLVRTPLTEPMYADPEIRARREALVPMRRIADTARDIAGIVAFLLDRDAAYCTGQNIVADGGLIDSIQTHIAGRPATGGAMGGMA